MISLIPIMAAGIKRYINPEQINMLKEVDGSYYVTLSNNDEWIQISGEYIIKYSTRREITIDNKSFFK